MEWVWDWFGCLGSVWEMGQVVFGSFSRPTRDWAWCLCKGVGRLGFGLWVIRPEGNNTLGYGLATCLAS